MEIECDVEDDELEELEVQRYSDNDCDHEYGDELKIKPGRCAMDPWNPGKFVMLTFDKPPMDPIVAMIVLAIFCSICCCIIVAVACGSKAKGKSYSEMSEDG